MPPAVPLFYPATQSLPMKTAEQIQTELNAAIAALLALAPAGETEAERAARKSTAAERAAAVRIAFLRAALAAAAIA